jgi:hypothetical protein
MLGGLLFRLKNKVPVPETLDLHDWSCVILHSPQTKQSRVCLSKSLIILRRLFFIPSCFRLFKKEYFFGADPKMSNYARIFERWWCVFAVWRQFEWKYAARIDDFL